MGMELHIPNETENSILYQCICKILTQKEKLEGKEADIEFDWCQTALQYVCIDRLLDCHIDYVFELELNRCQYTEEPSCSIT